MKQAKPVGHRLHEVGPHLEPGPNPSVTQSSSFWQSQHELAGAQQKHDPSRNWVQAQSEPAAHKIFSQPVGSHA